MAPSQRRPSSSAAPGDTEKKPTKPKPAPPPPRPSSSVLLLSPANDVLLLHRVQTSSAFASAHVFPGGNLDALHDGDVPAPADPARHRDGPAYRLGAIRETFEETGILLAKREGSAEYVSLSAEERDAARKRIHGNQVKFLDWLRSVGGVPDTDGLVPFTRWLTPANIPKRFTTQMYLYLLPLARSPSPPAEQHVPTPDGGVEHTAALFAPPATFLARAAAGSIVLFPPQAFLLTQLARFLPASGSASLEEGALHLAAQRKKLLAFVRRVPAADTQRGRAHATARVAWGDKVISPHTLLVRGRDQRAVLALDRPGPELEGSGRGGDWERVVLVKFGKGGPSQVEVRRREEVLEEEREANKTEEKL